MDEGWKERFRARVVYWTRPAGPDRRRALAMSNRTGVGQLYAWDVDGSDLRQLTDRPAGTVDGAISEDGRWVYFLDDTGGDELGHWARIPFEGGDAVDVTPDLPPYASDDLRTTRDGRRIAFTAALDDGFTVFLLDSGDDGDGPARELYRSSSLCGVAGFDAAGERLLVLSSERTGRSRYSLLVFDVETGGRVADLWDGPDSSISRATFSPVVGDTRVIAASDVKGDRRPLIWDAATGERSDPDPGGEGEVAPWDWSPDGSEILMCRVRDAVQELSILEVASGRWRRLDHPGGVFGFFGEGGTWFHPDDRIVAQWQDAGHPTAVIALDRMTGRRADDLLPPSAVPPSRPWRSISFVVDGGQRVQAWLATPAGAGPFPAVIETHGGPESVTMQSFAPRGQSWLDHGFAYLTINYRGSTTFGRAFKESIWGHPGDLEVADIVAGRRWLVDQGICLPDRVFLTGWSYGGFLTLQALGTAPGLWAGGMAGVAVADWVTEYEDENDVLRAYDRALFDGPPEERMDAYVKASPITHAEYVDAPVLVIQGRNDTRCPARQVEDYERKMRSFAKPIEVIWFDAGHTGGGDVERAISHQAAMLDFARRVLAREPVGVVATG